LSFAAHAAHCAGGKARKRRHAELLRSHFS
jgi:hypothetical protein